MSRKKQTKPQEPKKVENDIDINNIDVMFEDMKNLVLEKVEEKEETKDIVVAHEDANDEEIMNKDNVVISDEIKEKTEEEVTKEENENEVIEENKIEETEIGNIDNEIGTKEPIILNSEEDFDKVYIEEKPIEEKKEEPKKKNKSKRMTYEEMFGHTWMGYGFSY